jgi:hypothetical protein
MMLIEVQQHGLIRVKHGNETRLAALFHDR